MAAVPGNQENGREETKSYREILKSTALIGGASALGILIGLVRSKAVALMLGPSGVGLNGIYLSITGLAESVAGMGIGSSGVRQIAEAFGSGDHARVAKTAAVLRWTSLALGLLGAAILILFSVPISRLTFGDSSQWPMVCVLGVSVFLRLVSAGQGALMQGLRRIADMGRSATYSTVAATAAMLLLIYFLGEQGVGISIAVAAAIGLAASWWYTRDLVPGAFTVSLSEVREESAVLLHLGSALMLSGLVTLGANYAIRAAVLRQLGADAAGLYQAAWTLGGTYVGFILTAMSSDFYPRLTAAAHNNDECNRLVNEQAHVSVVLAGTGVIATLTFAPVALRLLYTTDFQGATTLLRWICMGTALQVVSWPMGFVILAKGAKALLVLGELAWAVVHLGLTLLTLRWYGLTGAGGAFLGAYVFHIGFNYAMARRLSGYCWSGPNRTATIQYLALIGSVFVVTSLVPSPWGMLAGTLLLLVSAAHSLRALAYLLPPENLPSPVLRLMLGVRRLVPAVLGQADGSRDRE